MSSLRPNTAAPFSTREGKPFEQSRRRRLNIPLGVGVVVTFAMAAAALYFTHRGQSRRTADALLRKSNEADGQGNRTLALKYLEQYLSYRPGDRNEQAHFAVLHADLASDYRAKRNAYFLLDRALLQDPKQDDIRRRIATLALELGARDAVRIADAVQHLRVLLKAHPDDAELMEEIGRCHEATRKYTEAVDWYGKAVKTDPGQVTAWARFAHLLRTKLDRADQADEMIDKMIAANPGAALAWLTRFRYREQFDRPGADGDLEKARELAPDDREVLLASGQRAQKLGDLDRARRDYQRGVARYPNAVRLRLALAALEAQTTNLEEAEKCLQAGVALSPQNYALRLALIEARIQTGAVGKARAEISALRGRGAAREPLDLLESEIAISQNNWDDAAERLEHLLPSVAHDTETARAVNLALAQCYHRLGDLDREFAARLKAAELAGDSPETWLDLVRRLAAANQNKKADEAAQRAARMLSARTAPVTLARCYAAMGLTGRASEYFRAAVAAQPENATVLRRVIEFALSLDDHEAALMTLQRMANASSRTRDDAEWGRHTLLTLLTDRRDYAALADFRRQLAGQSGSSPTDQSSEGTTALRAKALSLAASRGRAKRRQAIRLMQQVVQGVAPEIEDRFLLACLYEDDRDWPNALEQLRQILATAGDRPHYLAHGARALLRFGKLDEAQRWLDKLRESEPCSPRTLALQTKLLKAQGKSTDAIARIGEIVSRDESQSHRLSALLEDIGEVKAAENVLRRYASSARKPETQLALARLLGRQGRVDEALDCCETAAATCIPDEVAAALIMVLDSVQPTSRPLQRAEDWLLRALRDDPDSMALNFTLASLRKIEGRLDEAESLYRKLIARGEPTGLALNNLAYLLAADEKHRDEASALIDRAIVLHTPQPGLLDTRSYVSLRSGKTSLAIDDLEAAASKVPSALRFFRLAEAYHAAHDDTSARESLREAERYGLQDSKLRPADQARYRELVATLAKR